MKIGFGGVIASLAFTTMCGGTSATDVPAPSGVSCSPSRAATFAWWAGTWAYAVPGFDPGTTTVTTADAGCTIHEEFVDINNNKAHTTISFDTTSGQWKRSVTDPFRTYTSAGTFATDGSIAFYETPMDRETYRPVDPTRVHFSGETSTDGGKTWKLLFDATYTRKP